MPLIVIGAGFFGVAWSAAAVMPAYTLFGIGLVVVGAASQTVTTSTVSLVQMLTTPVMRGRVMTILLAIAPGGKPIGAPFVGWIANAFGPRWAIGAGAPAGLTSAMVGLRYLWMLPDGCGPQSIEAA